MKRKYRLVIGMIALVSISCLTEPVVERSREDGVAALDRGDYASALRLLGPRAKQGDARAQSKLGYMYAEGLGVPQDWAEAAKWFRKAAEQGDARAQVCLGNAYSLGEGVPQDYAEAAKWFREAGEQGEACAQVSLGSMYFVGQGVSQDYVQAYMWLRLAVAHSSDQDCREASVAVLVMLKATMTPQQIAEAEALATNWKPKEE